MGIDKELEDIITTMSDAITNDINGSKVVELLVDYFEKSPYDFSNPDIYNTMFGFKFDMIMESVIKKLHPEISNEVEDKFKPQFIFMHYGYFITNIEKLIETKRKTSSCVADVSRFVMKMYLDYALTGYIPETDLSEKYWKPRFGTNEEWINYCDGLYKLYYGNPTEYMQAYAKLLSAEIRKYKHIQHNFYLIMKNGDKILTEQTYDKTTIIKPQEGYYYVPKQFAGKQPYKDRDSGIFGKFYYAIPETDVERVEEVETEIMI